MPLGLSVASRSGLPARRFAELASDAEHAGFDVFLVAERVADAFALCQAALAATERITVGTAIANARLRHPALTAMTAATMDELYGGRVLLGLGVANTVLNEVTFGLPPANPVPYVRDYVDVVRRVLAGERDAGTQVRGLQLDRPPARQDIPILVAALQPRMLRLAGEIGDGVLLNLTTPATLPGALAEVAKAGRDVTVACVLPCALGVDDEESRQAGRELVVGYALHPAATQLFGASGYVDELAAIAALLRDGHRAEALELVSDALVDEFLLRGDERQVVDRVNAYQAAGVDLPVLFPVAAEGGWDAAVRRTIEFTANIRPSITKEVPV
ncbi:LLM class flavin-dependent oxidoreductase [Actinophytocola oryzae]|uniref:Alkanesulfonate monooxygenase SsuD/methylene tetrahydromethanopterin reductase-like flavin-dependent oxidoreductase (Luciferase family) n=1 Tax=Actinophytocola oryzae TaxID=502181 RepID=A0A4R7W3C6_9PSEU|nr:LLM class flavin-dependent oxidoreductase [Actinophytocola oryzae]TDV56419.1 alkanesulfonate monooxygenase SsuD/methylene tetrahydromethanopterin reductase-like flavin-dependent oxidoreductase (luciferase family) [Actinophytocola oryzae]